MVVLQLLVPVLVLLLMLAARKHLTSSYSLFGRGSNSTSATRSSTATVRAR